MDERCFGIITKQRTANRRLRPRKLTIRQHYQRVIDMCTDYLETKLTVNNCIDTLIFAHNHQMQRLSQLAAMFIDVNFEFVFTSDEFLELNTDQVISLMPLLIYNEMSEVDMNNAMRLWSKYKRAEQKKRNDLIRPNYRKISKNRTNDPEDTTNIQQAAEKPTEQMKSPSNLAYFIDVVPSPPPAPSISSQIDESS